jgi:hypothetical protein
MSNPLHLDGDTLFALRAIQNGHFRPASDDPVWRRLEKAGLAVLSRSRNGAGEIELAFWQLTVRGDHYARERPSREEGQDARIP